MKKSSFRFASNAAGAAEGKSMTGELPQLARVLHEIEQERRCQIASKGHTAKSDDGLEGGELARIAGVYALHAGMELARLRWPSWSVLRHFWPRELPNFKPRNPRRNLVMAAALLVAEIERLDRAHANERSSDSERCSRA
jgi:hypothetical protein